jgi:hypothetical protein
MRALACIALISILAFEPARALAQDRTAELEALRSELETLRKAMGTLADRIKVLEAQPAAPLAPGTAAPGAPAAPAPVAAAPPAAPAPAGQPYVGNVAQAPPGSGPPSLMDVARPREPFALYERRGAGQLLFDVGLRGDFVANLTQRNVDKANGGSFSGRENRFFPRAIELALFGQVDPYARAEVRIEAGEEDPGEISLNLAEAHLTLLTLPFGTQAKLGQMRTRFGLLNEIHEDDRPQIDSPNVLVRFFGEEGLVERGAEVTWVVPLPWYVQLVAGVFDGDNETLFGRGKLNEPLVTGRLRTFLDFEEWGAVQLGASVASGPNADRRQTTVVGVDAKYKYTPDGWQHALVTVGGEWLHLWKPFTTEGADDNGDGILDHAPENRTREKSGWYVWVDVQPWKRWLFGVRYDWTEFPNGRGREWTVGPYVSFMPSDFLRFRLGYKHTERDKRDLFGENGGSARIVDEILLQATFLLGAHPAHPF